MLIVSLYGGLVSQIRAFYMGYKLHRKFADEFILDLSQYYNGYYRSYLMDFMKMPNYTRIALRGTLEERIKLISGLYKKRPEILADGDELERAYHSYDIEKVYYIVNDCCCYDEFCTNHHEFFFRYIGDDAITNEIMDMMELAVSDSWKKNEGGSIRTDRESVGVHIRLRDFVHVGWMVERDYDFYRAAIQWCREKLRNPLFYIFSDDIELAKTILGEFDDFIYEEDKAAAQNDVEQLLRFSKCKHKILSKKSGFSLFAAAIARNKWKLDGYTIIIEQMNLAKDAGDREYVDSKFNKTPILKWEDNLSNCVQLKRADIDELNRRYVVQSRERESVNANIVTGEKNEGKNAKAVFLTFQTFSGSYITGMEKMAQILADSSYDVHFVGKRTAFDGQGEEGEIEWTIHNACQAKNANADSLGYMLYPYSELNHKGNYEAFIQYMCNGVANHKIYFIVRKKQGLPLIEEHQKYNARFIFIDFTDKYEIENIENLSENDMYYLYANADMIITFNDSIPEQYREFDRKIVFVDIEKFFPTVKIWQERTESMSNLKGEDDLYRYIEANIRSYFDEDR